MDVASLAEPMDIRISMHSQTLPLLCNTAEEEEQYWFRSQTLSSAVLCNKVRVWLCETIYGETMVKHTYKHSGMQLL